MNKHKIKNLLNYLKKVWMSIKICDISILKPGDFGQ
jgi:hypothetical protein